MNVLKIKTLVILSVCITYFATAQEESLVQLKVKDKDSIPTFIKFKKKEKRFNKGQEKAVFKKYLKLTGNDELKKVHSKKDNLGFTHEKYQQYYKGIKVEFARYNVHSREGKIDLINGHFRRIGNIKIIPEISEEIALQKALEYIGASEYMWEIPNMEEWIKKEKNDPDATYYPKAEIVIVKNQFGNGDMKLAFKFDIEANLPYSKNYVYVDAITGKIINNQPQIVDIVEINNVDTRYSGARHIDTYYDSNEGGYVLRDYSRGDGIEVYNVNNHASTAEVYREDYVDNDNNWTSTEWDNADMDNAALDALWAAQKTYDYFWEKHGRNSYDNEGSVIRCYTHYGNDYAASYVGNGSIYLGDGDYRYWPLTSIDVVAHEFGHGVCLSSANLYFGDVVESAALHEGLSDIWGACVENYADPEKNEWITGEDIDKISFCTRSLMNPNAKGHPDTYEGNYWYTGTSVSEYMHSNNGVLNYWFYLLSEGGNGTNDNGDYYQVDGIGIGDASKIVFRMETVGYLEIESTFEDARLFALQCASDLFGINSSQVIQTGRAWYAVGVGEENVLPIITDSQIRGGSNYVPYNSIDAFFVTPAEGATRYKWSIIPYMSCASYNLPYFVGSNTGTSVSVKHGICSGQYILRCEAFTDWSKSYYQDRVITVYNPSGGGGDPIDPCDPVMTIYPNPAKKSEVTILKIQYPPPGEDPCDEYPELYSAEEYEVKLFDLSGNLLLQDSFNSDTYSFKNSHFKNGIYVLTIKDKKGKSHQKRFTIK